MLLVVGAVAAAWFATGGDEEPDPRAGSTRLDVEPGLLEVDAAPTAYRIDYRVESFARGEVRATSDRLLVRRPFASRLESYDGPEPIGEPSSIQTSDLGGLHIQGAGESVTVAAPPAAGVSDVRVGASLDDALDDGRFELRERREVLGRECQVIRTAFTLATSDLVPPSSPGDHADTCIDASGLVLEEVLVADGEPLLRRVAIEVEVEPALGDDVFEVGEPDVPTDEGGGFFAELVPGSRSPGDFYDVRDVPTGFERLGRYAVVPTQVDNFADATRRGRRLTFVTDVFVDGSDLVALDQGGTLGNVDPFPDLQGVPVEVDVEGGSDAVLTYGQSGPVIVVRLPEGRFLRARTTADPALLVDLLAALEVVEGGELELVEPG